jgi:hypothetical protein
MKFQSMYGPVQAGALCSASFCRALDSVILLSLLPIWLPSHFPCPCSSCSFCNQSSSTGRHICKKSIRPYLKSLLTVRCGLFPQFKLRYVLSLILICSDKHLISRGWRQIIGYKKTMADGDKQTQILIIRNVFFLNSFRYGY